MAVTTTMSTFSIVRRCSDADARLHGGIAGDGFTLAHAAPVLCGTVDAGTQHIDASEPPAPSQANAGTADEKQVRKAWGDEA